MKRKSSNILKKTIKIASVTCFALGGAALIASGAAVKALTEGAKYLKNTVEKIVRETPEAEQIVEEVPAAVAEEVPAAEAEA
jgi:hypothetical protein